MNDDEFDDYYALLKVPPAASSEEIKRAYLFEMRYWAPDNYFSKPKEYQEEPHRRSVKLNQAWEVLKDPARRTQYDEILAQWKKWKLHAQTTSQGAVSRANEWADGLGSQALLWALKLEAAKTRGDTTDKAGALRKLLEVLKLEIKSGCSNAAVLGGLDQFFRVVSHDVLVSRLLDTCWGMGLRGNTYAALTPNLRSWWIGEVFAASDATEEIRSLWAPLAHHPYTEAEKQWEREFLDKVLGLDDEAPPKPKVPDLTEALRASVEAARRSKESKVGVRISFGRYKGRTFEEIAYEEPGYLKWMIDEGAGPRRERECAQAALDAISSGSGPSSSPREGRTNNRPPKGSIFSRILRSGRRPR